jgi:hypothetical protein
MRLDSMQREHGVEVGDLVQIDHLLYMPCTIVKDEKNDDAMLSGGISTKSHTYGPKALFQGLIWAWVASSCSVVNTLSTQRPRGRCFGEPCTAQQGEMVEPETPWGEDRGCFWCPWSSQPSTVADVQHIPAEQ